MSTSMAMPTATSTPTKASMTGQHQASGTGAPTKGPVQAGGEFPLV